jgi:hypothetical protein
MRIMQFLLNLSHFRQSTSTLVPANVVGQDEFVKSMGYLKRLTSGGVPFPLRNEAEINDLISSLVAQSDCAVLKFGTSQLKKKASHCIDE